uniref:C2H2-type domain-containing protein n=1 Tax=Panagrolaimus davidi TaxID=227884 RepID=A0A914PTR3_9BILA
MSDSLEEKYGPPPEKGKRQYRRREKRNVASVETNFCFTALKDSPELDRIPYFSKYDIPKRKPFVYPQKDYGFKDTDFCRPANNGTQAFQQKEMLRRSIKFSKSTAPKKEKPIKGPKFTPKLKELQKMFRGKHNPAVKKFYYCKDIKSNSKAARSCHTKLPSKKRSKQQWNAFSSNEKFIFKKVMIAQGLKFQRRFKTIKNSDYNTNVFSLKFFAMFMILQRLINIVSTKFVEFLTISNMDTVENICDQQMDFGWDLIQISPYYYYSETIIIFVLLYVIRKLLLSADDYYDNEEVLQNRLENILQCYKSIETFNRKNLSENVCNTLPNVENINLTTVSDPVLKSSKNVKIDNPIYDQYDYTNEPKFQIMQTSNNNKYSNLNLNQNHQSSKIVTMPSHTTSSNNMKSYDYTVSNDENGTKDSWKHSPAGSSKSSNYSSTFVQDKELKIELKNNISSKNKSTISLNIAAYENSNESAKSDVIKNGLKNERKIAKDYFPLPQNPFEFPRQQDSSLPKPKVSQFRAFQHLLNPNEANKAPRRPSTSSTKRPAQNINSEPEHSFKRRSVDAEILLDQSEPSAPSPYYPTIANEQNYAFRKLQPILRDQRVSQPTLDFLATEIIDFNNILIDEIIHNIEQCCVPTHLLSPEDLRLWTIIVKAVHNHTTESVQIHQSRFCSTRECVNFLHFIPFVDSPPKPSKKPKIKNSSIKATEKNPNITVKATKKIPNITVKATKITLEPRPITPDNPYISELCMLNTYIESDNNELNDASTTEVVTEMAGGQCLDKNTEMHKSRSDNEELSESDEDGNENEDEDPTDKNNEKLDSEYEDDDDEIQRIIAELLKDTEGDELLSDEHVVEQLSSQLDSQTLIHEDETDDSIEGEFIKQTGGNLGIKRTILSIVNNLKDNAEQYPAFLTKKSSHFIDLLYTFCVSLAPVSHERPRSYDSKDRLATVSSRINAKLPSNDDNSQNFDYEIAKEKIIHYLAEISELKKMVSRVQLFQAQLKLAETSEEDIQTKLNLWYEKLEDKACSLIDEDGFIDDKGGWAARLKPGSYHTAAYIMCEYVSLMIAKNVSFDEFANPAFHLKFVKFYQKTLSKMDRRGLHLQAMTTYLRGLEKADRQKKYNKNEYKLINAGTIVGKTVNVGVGLKLAGVFALSKDSFSLSSEAETAATKAQFSANKVSASVNCYPLAYPDIIAYFEDSEVESIVHVRNRLLLDHGVQSGWRISSMIKVHLSDFKTSPGIRLRNLKFAFVDADTVELEMSGVFHKTIEMPCDVLKFTTRMTHQKHDFVLLLLLYLDKIGAFTKPLRECFAEHSFEIKNEHLDHFLYAASTRDGRLITDECMSVNEVDGFTIQVALKLITRNEGLTSISQVVGVLRGSNWRSSAVIKYLNYGDHCLQDTIDNFRKLQPLSPTIKAADVHVFLKDIGKRSQYYFDAEHPLAEELKQFWTPKFHSYKIRQIQTSLNLFALEHDAPVIKSKRAIENPLNITLDLDKILNFYTHDYTTRFDGYKYKNPVCPFPQCDVKFDGKRIEHISSHVNEPIFCKQCEDPYFSAKSALVTYDCWHNHMFRQHVLSHICRACKVLSCKRGIVYCKKLGHNVQFASAIRLHYKSSIRTNIIPAETVEFQLPAAIANNIPVTPASSSNSKDLTKWQLLHEITEASDSVEEAAWVLLGYIKGTTAPLPFLLDDEFKPYIDYLKSKNKL